MQPRERVAIVGAGISGLSLAYYLSQRDRYDLTLIESSPELGGHAHSVDIQGHCIDTTVIAFHEQAYPNFVALIKELGVFGETEAFRHDLCFHSNDGTEYLINLKLKNWLLDFPKIVKTSKSLKKLSASVVQAKKQGDFHADEPLTDFLQRYSFNDDEVHFLVLPMLHMFMGLDYSSICKLPAWFVIKHLYDHKLLHHSSLHSWRSWKNGTRTYVTALEKRIRGHILTGRSVLAIRQNADQTKTLHLDDAIALSFDKVILATPPKHSFQMLLNPTPLESQLLAPWSGDHLRRTIHTDDSLLARTKRHRGFWNPYINKEPMTCGASYLLHKINPRLPEDLIVSWAPIQNIRQDRILEQADVAITRFDRDALSTHSELFRLNHQGHGIYYCGAYFGLGWHEAGVSSALDTFNLLCNTH